MLRRSAALGTLTLLLITSALFAQAPTAGRTWMKEISPFLSPETVIVGRLRLDLLDLDSEKDAVRSTLGFGLPQDPLAISKLLAKKPIQEGVSELGVVVTAPEFEGDTTFLTLARLNGKVSADQVVASILGEEEPDEELTELYSVQKGKWLAVTTRDDVTETIREQIPFTSAKFGEAADLLGDDPVQVIGTVTGDTIYALTQDHEHPSLMQYYAHKLKFAAAGYTLGSAPRMRVALQFNNQEDAAEALDWLDVLTTPGNLDNPVGSLVAAALRPYLPTQSGDRLVVQLDQANQQKIKDAFAPAIAKAQQAAQEMSSINNLKIIGLAFHNFHDTYGSFPPPQSPNVKDGKPLLSWRVHLLPFIEHGHLYEQFHLDEPWDSEHNIKLASVMPSFYRQPGVTLKDPRTTTYVVPQGKKTIIPGDGTKTGFRNVIDGTSNTIMAFAVKPEAAVIWTKPDDWQFDPQQPLKNVDVKEDGTFSALFVDGSVQTLSGNMKSESMRRLIEINDGQVVDWDDIE